MLKLSYKHKVIAASIGLVIVSGVLFGYVFPLLDKTNADLSDKTFNARKELAGLQAEQRNFELGLRDLKTLAEKQYHPEKFFSSDTSLVNEIQTLEATARNLGLDLAVNVTGTVDKAQKAKTTTDIRTIPVTLQIIGPFTSAMQFVESLEHLSFITNIKTVTISPDSETGGLSMQLSGNFYVKK